MGCLRKLMNLLFFVMLLFPLLWFLALGNSMSLLALLSRQKRFMIGVRGKLGLMYGLNNTRKCKMNFQSLIETNSGLQKEIRRRMGDYLDDLDHHELGCLGQEVENSVKIIRERKYKKLDNQIDTTKKKDIPKEEPQYGLVDNGDYNHVLGYNDDSRVLALRLQPCQPNLHVGAGAGLCVTYTLL